MIISPNVSISECWNSPFFSSQQVEEELKSQKIDDEERRRLEKALPGDSRWLEMASSCKHAQRMNTVCLCHGLSVLHAVLWCSTFISLYRLCCIYIYTWLYIYILYIHMYIHNIFICIYIYIYIRRIYIYTHTHNINIYIYKYII